MCLFYSPACCLPSFEYKSIIFSFQVIPQHFPAVLSIAQHCIAKHSSALLSIVRQYKNVQNVQSCCFHSFDNKENSRACLVQGQIDLLRFSTPFFDLVRIFTSFAPFCYRLCVLIPIHHLELEFSLEEKTQLFKAFRGVILATTPALPSILKERTRPMPQLSL